MTDRAREWLSRIGEVRDDFGQLSESVLASLLALVDEAVQAEREACARVAEGYQPGWLGSAIGPLWSAGAASAAEIITTHIRARGSPPTVPPSPEAPS